MTATFDRVILIPSLNPNEKLIQLVQDLKEEGFFRILVVDDGSDAEYTSIFKRVQAQGCVLVHHEKNLGKGAAIKTALKNIMAKWGHTGGCITVDADGQHLPRDIRRVAETMAAHPNSLVLGVRDFRSKNVPMKSMLGNRITTVFFRLTNGVTCPDTQTGLRGIPQNLMELALAEEGSRYEYEMNFLMDAVRIASLEYVPIETVYENHNRGSHFRPIADSCRVYSRFLRFLAASMSGATVDYILFCAMVALLSLSQTPLIFAATVLARMGSGLVNYLLNRYWSFRSKMPMGREMGRYCILFLGQMLASAGLVMLLSYLSLPVMLAKVIVDTALFFVSFRIQKDWVFRCDSSLSADRR